MSDKLEAMYQTYVDTLGPAATPTPGRRDVHLFDRHADYDKFVGPGGVGTGGLFVANSRTFLATYLQDQGRDELRRLLQHEGFHQFAYFSVRKNLPVWLNEGLAQLYEEAIFTGDKYVMGEIPPRRVRQLKLDRDANRLTPIAEQIKQTRVTWNADRKNRAAVAAANYSQAWALAEYLAHGPDADDVKKWAHFLLLVHTTASDPSKLFTQTFDDLPGLQKRFDAWLDALAPTPLAEQLERQQILADLLIAASTAGAPADVAAFEKIVVVNHLQVQYSRGIVQYSSDDHPAIYFTDAAGKHLDEGQLFLKADGTGPLPMIVRRPSAGLELTSRFYKLDDAIQSETTVKR